MSLSKDLVNLIKKTQETKTSPYDTQAEVVRVEGQTAWVHIPGGVEETPVRLTINAKKGDMVNIHVANGSAWITGNSTNPPTDDTTALKAINFGETAINYIGQVKESVDVVYILAENAMTSANGKNKVYRQAVAPTGGTYAVGDIWFDTANDNKINRWDGSAWVAFTLGDDALDSISANKLTAGEIDASVITVSNIDAGNLTTGVLLADRIGANTITASKMRIGDYRNYVTATENDATSLIGASTANSIVDGWIYKSDASATNLWVSPVLNNWTKESEQYRITGIVKMTVAGKAKVSIYGRDNATYSAQSVKETNWVVIPANTETEINDTITISSGVAAQPKSNIAIQFQTTDGTTYTGYFKKLRVERMSDADLIVDGSITADKIHANAITIGKMDSSTQSQVLNSNMQIGGRNLLTGTAESKNLTTAANQNYFNPQPYKLSEYANVAIVDTSNTQIAVSFDYSITDVDTAFNMTVSLRTALPTTYSAGFIVASIPVGNSSGRAFGTRDITSAMRQYAQGYGIMVSGSGSNNANAKLTISNVKLEFGNKATDWSPAPEDVEDYTDEVAATLSDSFNGALAETASELSGSIEDVRTLAGSKADATALSSLSTQMQEYIGEGGYIYANNGTLIIATGRDIGNFKIGIDGTQIVFYENDNAVAYINNNRLYISRSEVTDEQKISNFAFKKRDDGRFTLMYVGG